jgi:hypothetical protein
MAMMVVGFLLLVEISPQMNYFLVLLPSFVIFATGASVSFATSQILAKSKIDKSQEGIASGIINTSS